MFLKRTPALLALCIGTSTASAGGGEFEPLARDYYKDVISIWANTPTVINALRANNIEPAGHSASEIADLDQKWRAEVGNAETPVISSILNKAASDYLRERVAASGGAITEIILIDAKGLNAAISSVTSDYFQGDEAQFLEVFHKGSGYVRVGDVELDESTQVYQMKVSFPIIDTDTNRALGTMTVALNPQVIM